MAVASPSLKPSVETFQLGFELDLLVALYNRHAPERVLEIGSWHGGTLWHWLQPEGTTVVAVDDEMRESDDWQQWADDAGSRLHTIRGRSQDPDVVRLARGLGPYGFVFIDGDHSYDAVRADFENYSAMAAPGAIVALHDIVPRHGYGVSQLWDEIRASGRPTVEIVEDRSRWHGIGAVWM